MLDYPSRLPRKGDTVHYISISPPGIDLVGIVVNVIKGHAVDLFVLPNGREVFGSGFLAKGVGYASKEEGGINCWHWPDED